MLLAARLLTGAGRIVDGDDELVRPAAQEVGEVDGERVESARVRCDVGAVHEDRGVPVDGAEVQQSASVRAVMVEGAPIPEPRVGGHATLDAGEPAFDAEGHENLAVPCVRQRRVPGPDRVLPAAVEILPAVAHEQWAWILGPGAVGSDRLAPTGQHAVSGSIMASQPASALRCEYAAAPDTA